MSAVKVSNVRLATPTDRGYATGMFEVDISFDDGREFSGALTVPFSGKGVQRGGQCSPAWSDACFFEMVTPDEATAAGTAAREAVKAAVVAWPLAKTARTLTHVERPNADGNFPVQWELTCPHCGSPEWDHIDERGSWGILRCKEGHLSKVAILEHNSEKLFTVHEAR